MNPHLALAAALAGLIVGYAPDTSAQATPKLVTIYCVPEGGGSPYSITAASEHAKCRSGDRGLTAAEYEAWQRDRAKAAAFPPGRALAGAPIVEWTSASRPGDASVFTFRSWRINDPLANGFSDYLVGHKRAGRAHCDVDSPRQFISCEDQSIIRRSAGGPKQAYLDDIAVDRLTYYFTLTRSLYGFSLVFPTLAFDRIEQELRSRYGPPHRTEADVIKNRAGARFDVKVATWDTPHGPMTLRSRHESIGSGTLQLFDAKVGPEPPKPRVF
ncbi:MAG: hypothetical protein FJX60_14055 [Alphaproteobacteria bacterium]|nr:hypothetical protein [Alphaproteobacteria bacterium]